LRAASFEVSEWRRRWEKRRQEKKGVYESKGSVREGVGKTRMAWRRIDPADWVFSAVEEKGQLGSRSEGAERNRLGGSAFGFSSGWGAAIVERIASWVSVELAT
jgi:hypothetical protein